MKRLNLFLLCGLIILLNACKTDTVKSINTTSIKLDNSISDATILLNGDPIANKKYATDNPIFFDLYTNQILGIPDSSRLGRADSLVSLSKVQYIKGLQDTIKLGIGATGPIEQDFIAALKLLKYYLPNYKTPSIYFCNTLFNYQLFLFSDRDRDAIGIGLDLFLNKYYNYKQIDPQNPSYSDYLTIHFDKDHIVPKAMYLAINEALGSPNGVRLIDQMIHNGKKLYLLKQILPNTSEPLVMDYTDAQYEFCDKQELEIWSFFLDEKLLYETSPSKINKYLNPSPDAPGMPEAAPGRVANYIGLRVVEQWMNKNKKTIADLLAQIDAQLLLDESKYKPKR